LSMISAQTLRVCRRENQFPLFGIMLETLTTRSSPVEGPAARRPFCTKSVLIRRESLLKCGFFPACSRLH
jgi:hypothetical protein